jgi:acyl-CoA reductase-like NAD-dependent aldehyde dehydrogenase
MSAPLPSLPYVVAGQPVPAASAPRRRVVHDVFRGTPIAEAAWADAAEVERAIAAAHGARATMRAMPAHARAAALEALATALGARAEALARTVCAEAGKPIQAARGEVTRLLETVRTAAAEAVRIDGELLALDRSSRSTGARGVVQRVPIGACAFLTPFNFPLNLVAHKIAPAIAAGCPFVLRPSERTPLSALLLGECLMDAGLPAGAWSIVPCDVADAGALVTDARLALLSFTGGEIGWDLRARAGRKQVVLELGGNAACIVDDDQGPALDHVVERIVVGGYGQAGQSCISVQHVVAHAAIYDDLRARLLARVQALPHGDPHDETTVVGPVIDDAAAARLVRWIDDAVAAGGRRLCGGARDGKLVQATLLEDVPATCDLAAREAFGPVVLLTRVASFDEAVARVNASAYGLQAGVFTDRLAHATRAWDQLEVGAVVIGDVPTVRIDAMPYGGVKGSGVGREGVRAAIAAYTEPRLLLLQA